MPSYRRRGALLLPVSCPLALLFALLLALLFVLHVTDIASGWRYPQSRTTGMAANQSTLVVTKTVTDTQVAKGSPTQQPKDRVVLDSVAANQSHSYREDGLLQVNPDGPHPIFELIERAEREWQKKLERASQSLDEAVEEYHRRYKRSPPKGFNHWYAQMPARNNLILNN
jgi:hypothetical protein